MPETLLEKIFSCWFEFAGNEPESTIEETARQTAATSLPGGLGSFLHNFWQRRPTRLFSMLAEYHPERPQAWFSFLDSEIRRLPLVLAYCSYSRSQLENLKILALKNVEISLERMLNR